MNENESLKYSLIRGCKIEINEDCRYIRARVTYKKIILEDRIEFDKFDTRSLLNKIITICSTAEMMQQPSE